MQRAESCKEQKEPQGEGWQRDDVASLSSPFFVSLCCKLFTDLRAVATFHHRLQIVYSLDPVEQEEEERNMDKWIKL